MGKLSLRMKGMLIEVTAKARYQIRGFKEDVGGEKKDLIRIIFRI